MFLRNYNAFLSIESLCWIVSNTCNYSETKNQRMGILLNPVHFMFTTTLRHITNAASIASYHYKKERPPLF